MKRLLLLGLALLVAGSAVSAQEHAWQGIHRTPLSEAAAQFANPPAEFASHVIWGWEGPMAVETIRHDLDSIKTKGFQIGRAHV